MDSGTHKQTEAELKLPPITEEITTDEFQKAFAVVSEHTSLAMEMPCKE